MTASVRCLYCRHDQPATRDNCEQCGMPLPDQVAATSRKLRRFTVFCLLLAVFCAVMIIWLPRTLV